MNDILCFVFGFFLTGCASNLTPVNLTDGGLDFEAEIGKNYRWTFVDGSLPEQFFVVLGKWEVMNSRLKQTGKFQKGDYPRILVKDVTFSNAVAKVRCKPESGETDQACGLILRAKDSSNYYMTRANALENNVRLYRIIDNDRQTLASNDISVKNGEWHTLELRAYGDELKVTFNGTEVISIKDPTFSRGKLGLWTKADSVTEYDDLEAQAISP